MATKTLDFFQIYYDESQMGKIYPFAIPYLNTNLTWLFENEVIKELVPKSEADLISVCSWRLSEKRADRILHLKDASLTKEKILYEDYDIAVLTPRSKSHKMLFMSAQWHLGVWSECMNELRGFMKVPREVNTAIYENHFIANKEIYHDYVENCLLPCIDFMSSKDSFMADAGYARRKSEIDRQLIAIKLGRKDWPIAPFILERLFSIWINNKSFKIVNL